MDPIELRIVSRVLSDKKSFKKVCKKVDSHYKNAYLYIIKLRDMKGLELLFNARVGEVFTVDTAYENYPNLIFMGFEEENADVTLACFTGVEIEQGERFAADLVPAQRHAGDVDPVGPH